MRVHAPRYRELLPKFVSSSILETYPLLFSGGGYLMQSPVYEVLRQYLVSPYFSVFEMELPDAIANPQKLRANTSADL